MPFNSEIKGWLGEARTILAKKLFLKSSIYVDINDLFVPSRRGITQIDHVIVSRFGIFVVETKNLSGTIYGHETSAEWVQYLGGREFHFQNPLRQNYRHIAALSELLGVSKDLMFSVVVIWGNCKFIRPIPPNVLTGGFVSYLKRPRPIIFDDVDVQQIVAAIKQECLPKSSINRYLHVSLLRERFAPSMRCPQCGSSLALRRARFGIRVGSQFYGCTAYPVCRYTRSLRSHPDI